MKKTEIQIENRECYLYSTKNPEFVLIQPVDEHDIAVLDNEVSQIKNSGMEFILSAFRIHDWNSELTAWNAPQAFGDNCFGDKAGETLQYITENLIPELNRMFHETEKYILGGYSLAGLFSLWSAYQTDIFSGISAVSPSVWIKGWIPFAESHEIRAEAVYLSLGNHEHKTRNAMMKTVRGNIIRQSELLKNQKSVLEWNEGNHFQNPDLRTAKGFVWIMEQLRKSKGEIGL